MKQVNNIEKRKNMKVGFDHKKYLEEQSKYILERVNKNFKAVDDDESNSNDY
mgnify:CR=1 FL=1